MHDIFEFYQWSIHVRGRENPQRPKGKLFEKGRKRKGKREDYEKEAKK